MIPDIDGAAARSDPPGYTVRAMAVRLVSAVLDKGRSLDDALSQEFAGEHGAALSSRDKGMSRLIAATTLRRKGELEAIVSSFIEKPLPAERGLLSHILLTAAAQLVILRMAPHAVISIAVDQTRRDRGARRFDKLTNAVLRRTSERGSELLTSGSGARLNFPAWLWQRWVTAYGESAAGQIARASQTEAALDLTAKTDAPGWAVRLGGELLPTGSIRLAEHARIEDMPGFEDGAWWVQDAAAALPARLFGDVRDLDVLELCAAPGGKTAQLASAGARVTAVDSSMPRLSRLRKNLTRLGLEAETVCADVLEMDTTRQFDRILLDAPCTATGTIRRHPDIPHLKRSTDLGRLAALQEKLLTSALAWLRPGGRLVYCTCSLDPEEGEHQIRRLLNDNPCLSRLPVSPDEIGADPTWITPEGDLRTLPFHMPNADSRLAGMDGFFAARLHRKP